MAKVKKHDAGAQTIVVRMYGVRLNLASGVKYGARKPGITRLKNNTTAALVKVRRELAQARLARGLSQRAFEEPREQPDQILGDPHQEELACNMSSTTLFAYDRLARKTSLPRQMRGT